MWSDKADKLTRAARTAGTPQAHAAAAEAHRLAMGEHDPMLHTASLAHHKSMMEGHLARAGGAAIGGGAPSQHIVHATPHGTGSSVTPHDHALAAAHAGTQHGHTPWDPAESQAAARVTAAHIAQTPRLTPSTHSMSTATRR